jgi:hypothetical protein
MFTFVKLAFKYIISNKTKSMLMIFGFSLAVCLSVIIGNIFDSFLTAEVIKYKQNSFGYDFAYTGLSSSDQNTVKKILQKNKNVESIGTVADFGTSVIKDGLTIYLRGYDAAALQMFGIRLKKGEMPRNDNEACLEEWTLFNMRNNPQIGQKFKLEVKDNNGTVKSVEYVLSGILENTKDNTLSLNKYNILLLNNTVLGKAIRTDI